MGEIFRFAVEGDVDGVKREIFERGVDVNVSGGNECTPLHYSAQCGRLEVAKLLLSMGADLNKTDVDHLTPLHYSAEYNRVELVQLLLDSGAEVNAADVDGITPLFLAVAKGHLEVFQLLLRNRADVRCLNVTVAGKTALELCSDTQNKGIFLQILQRWILRCAISGNVEELQNELENGVDVNATTYGGWTPLHFSAWNGQVAVAKLLLKKGATIDAVDEEGRTPLVIAAECGHVELFYLLMRNGADPNNLDISIQIQTTCEGCSDETTREAVCHVLQLEKIAPKFLRFIDDFNPIKDKIDTAIDKDGNDDSNSTNRREREGNGSNWQWLERRLFESTTFPLNNRTTNNDSHFSFDVTTMKCSLLQLLFSLHSVERGKKGLEALDYIREVEPALRRSLEANACCSELTDAASVFRFANDPTHVGTFASETARKSLRESVFAPKENINNEGLQGSLRRVLEASDRLRMDLLSYTSDLSSDLSWTGLEEPTSLRTSVRTFMEKLDSVQDSVEESVLSDVLYNPLSDIPSEVGQSCAFWREYSEKRRGLHDRLSSLRSVNQYLDSPTENAVDPCTQLKKFKEEMESHKLTDSRAYKHVVRRLEQRLRR